MLIDCLQSFQTCSIKHTSAPERNTFQKSKQQVFSQNLSPSNGTADAFAIIYPVPFSLASNPKIQATLEVDGDVMYNLAIKNISYSGYTGVLSDNLAEANAKIHTFASVQ